MDFQEFDEHRALRDAVRAITAKFGPDYFVANAEAGEPCTDLLYTFKGQPATTLGGLTVPLTFRVGQPPKIPYCLFGAVSNAKNDGWKPAISTSVCTTILAPSDPQNAP